jgi:hypothetical protein
MPDPAPPVGSVIERSLAAEHAFWRRGLVLLRQGGLLCTAAAVMIVGMNGYALSRRLPFPLARPLLKALVALGRIDERLIAEARTAQP